MATLMTGMHAHAAQCRGNSMTLHQDHGSATLCYMVKLIMMLLLGISKACAPVLVYLRLFYLF